MKNNFDNLITNFENHANNNTLDTKEGTKALTDLATAIVYSVINKCLDPQRKKALADGKSSDSGQSPLLRKLKSDIILEQARQRQLDYCLDNYKTTKYNTNGDVNIIINAELDKTIGDLLQNPLSDCMDLINECIVAIMAECKRMTDNKQCIDLQKPYTQRVLSKKVVIQSNDSGAWADEIITPIQNIYRAVRRYIMDNRSFVADTRCKYTYIAELSADSESDTVDTIYRRLGKYADLGGYVRDFNGATTLYSVEEETVYQYYDLIEKLNLTKRQAEILDLRIKGYGQRAIATFLRIKPQSVQVHLSRIQKEAKKIGLIPPTTK